MKTLFLIHGRSWKPKRQDLRRLWLKAINAGLKRDFTNLDLKGTRVEFIYYGDISNAFLASVKYQGYASPPNSLSSREQSIAELKNYQASQFTRTHYRNLPGIKHFLDDLARVFGNTLPYTGLSEEAVAKVAPDMRHYWNEESSFGSEIRRPLIKPMQRALGRGDDICVVAHSLGTLIAYDTFWKASHYGEWYELRKKQISNFISLGSPLGDTTVQRNLKGRKSSGLRRYPTNIVRWDNFAAHDDYICHDARLKNDFKGMTRLGLIPGGLHDHKIYNLAITNQRGRSGKISRRANPHHISGYLMHPRFVSTIATWLTS